MDHAGGAESASVRRVADPASAAELIRPAFRRELTPTWLRVTTILAGHRPPEVDEPLRVLDLSCRSGITAAVVAAVHPDAEVWAGDEDPANVERAERLVRDARLSNLSVIERSSASPDDLSALPGPVDIVLLDDIISTTDDAGRATIAGVVSRHVRAGGLIAVVYRTRVRWAELMPLRCLARLLTRVDHPTATRQQLPAIVDLLGRMSSGGARYLLDRPDVAALVEQAASLDPDDLAEVLLTEHLEPMALADVAAWLAPAGATFIGSARLGGDLRLGADAPLLGLLRDTLDTDLREALSDLAVRPAFRVDVFRRGAAPLAVAEQQALLMDLELVSIAPSGPGQQLRDALDDVVAGALQRLGDGPTPVGDLLRGADGVAADDAVRVLLDRGLAHPRSAGWDGPETKASCDALNRCLTAAGGPAGGDVLAAPLIGSAVAIAGLDDDLLARLGI